MFRRPSRVRYITNLAETCGSRRLPGATQRSAALWAGRERTEKPGVKHHAGWFAGAACCNIQGRESALERISRVGLIHAKAAPLQAMGDQAR
jgi:hypothetical protein